jgi:hypothetical protein
MAMAKIDLASVFPFLVSSSRLYPCASSIFARRKTNAVCRAAKRRPSKSSRFLIGFLDSELGGNDCRLCDYFQPPRCVLASAL